MKEKVNKRIAASGLAACLLACGVIAGTLAYLQDSTSVIENEFTYGSINISLTEGAVDEYGNLLRARTSENQTYKLIPGHTYSKDPVLTIEANSEPCYAFLVVSNPIADLEDVTAGTIASQIETAGWTELTSDSTLYCDGSALSDDTTIYYKTASLSEEDQDLASFTTLAIDDNANVEEASGLSIGITAYAVQSDGFDSALLAWEATFGAE